MEEPTSPTAPLAAFPPQPEEYRSRAPEFYGFVSWSSTYLLFFFFILWGFLPDEWIVWSGVTWYPNREWALLLPAWSLVLVWLTYLAYFSLALFGTPALSDISTITDSKGRVLDPATFDFSDEGAATEMYDIPITSVNHALYDRS